MANTRFLNLELLETQGFTLAQLVAKINDSLEKLDQHNHTQARDIPLSSIVANSSLNFNQNSALNLSFIGMLSRSNSSTLNNSIYFKDGELFVRDGSGREIQISHEGGQAIASPGRVRGNLLAESPTLGTSGLSVNTQVNVTWDIPADYQSKYTQANGVISVNLEPVVASQFGYVIDVEVGGTVTSTAVLPYGDLPLSATGIRNTNDILRRYLLKLSSTQGLGVSYGRGVNDSLTLLYLSATLPANTVVKIYEAQVRGAPGAQGIQGIQGPSGDALTEAQRNVLEGSVQLDSISLSRDTNNLFFATDGGRGVTINLDNVASDVNPVTVRDKLEELSGEDRLPATAVKDLPAGSFTGLTDTPSTISPNQFVRGNSGGTALEYTDPPVDTGAQIKTKLEALRGDSRLDAEAIKGIVEGSRFVSVDTVPTDLTQYANGQVLRINTPVADSGDPTGQWAEVQGAEATERHSFGVDFVADPNNPARNTWVVGSQLSYGVSFTSSRYGNEYTAERGKAFTPDNAPVRSMVIELMVTRLPATGVHLAFSSNATMTIPRSQLTSAPNSLWVRYYNGPPSADNEVSTVEFVKSADNPAHTYHTYTERLADEVPSEVSDIESIRYFNLFTASPATGDQTSNPLQLHAVKSLKNIASPQSGASIVSKLSALQSGARLPASAIRDLPTGGGTIADTESVITPSLATGDYSSETIIGLTSSSIDSEQGITLSNNRITFSNAGTYIITCGFEVVSSGGADAGGQRTMAHVRLKKNGVDDESMEAEAYIRYSDTTHGNLITPVELALSGALKIEANDYIEFYLQTYNQTTATRHSIAASESSIKINRTAVGGSGGGGGTEHFVSLDDTPNSYSGQRGKVVQVNASETGLEFEDKLSGNDIVTRLQGLSGGARLNASAVQGLPAPETGATIKSKLEGLSGNARLDASAIQNLPSGGRPDSAINNLIDARVTPNALVANQGQTALPKFDVRSQASYNSLQTKDTNTLYLIVE